MPDPYLKGNGIWCPACGGTTRGDFAGTLEYTDGRTSDMHDICAACKGARRIALAPEEIVRATVSVHHRNIDSMPER